MRLPYPLRGRCQQAFAYDGLLMSYRRNLSAEVPSAGQGLTSAFRWREEPATLDDAKKPAKRTGGKEHELSIAVMVLAGFIVVDALGPFIAGEAKSLVAHFLHSLHEWDGTVGSLQGMFFTALRTGAIVLCPF